MALNPIGNTPADIVSRVRETPQDENITDLITFSKALEDKLKASSAWSDSDDIFTPKTGDHLTPAEKLSDFQRFWGLVVNQLASTGKDPQALLKTDGELFTKLSADLEALFSKTIAAKPVGQKIDLSDVKHLALLSVFSERLDNPVLVAYQDRLFANQAKRDAAQEELKGLSNELKIYGVIQSQLHSHLSTSKEYSTKSLLTASSFGFKTNEKFFASDVYATFIKVTGKNSFEQVAKNNGYTDDELFSLLKSPPSEPAKLIKYVEVVNQLFPTPKDWLDAKGISSLDTYSGDVLKDKLPNLGTAISDKSKLINDDVSLKTTELNQISSTYNSTVEAINRFVQKYNSVLQEILRAI